jgi:CubicO group peptidase (beta-lactamase class C family)
MTSRALVPLLTLVACACSGASSPKDSPRAAASPPPTPPPAAVDGGAAPPGTTPPPPPAPAGCNQPAFDAYVASVTSALTAAKAGAAVAIVCNGSVFAAGIGQTAATGGKPVDAHTRFNVGSTQKAFTAALAMRLVEEGTVGLDDAASKWVTGVNTQTPYARSCTLGELLAHVSGFPTQPPDTDQATDLEPFLQGMGQLPLWSAPGEVFNYNNVGFELAGLVMQKAAAQPFATLVEQKVFAPAGMLDARMDPAAVMREGNYATGYSGGGAVSPTDVVIPAMGPDTGAFTSVTDLAHFAQTLMAGGGAMLKPDSVAKMTTAHTPTDDPTTSYGYGMFVADRSGTAQWSHSGENTGYVADLSIVPSRGFASAILIASDGVDMPDAYMGAAATFTGAPLPPATDQGAFDPASTADHVGAYTSAAVGTITVQKSGAAMTITVGGQTATLTPMWRDTYTFPYAAWGGGDLEVNFWRVGGKVKYAVARAFAGSRNP